MDSGLQDAAVLLLVNGLSVEAAERALQGREKDIQVVKEAVAAARKRITVAADYSRDEQIGRAYLRLEDLYAKSVSGKDFKTALQTQKEINRLLDLYSGRDSAPAGQAATSDLERKLQLIASHILPLALLDASYPLEEHVRIACQWIRERGGHKRL